MLTRLLPSPLLDTAFLTIAGGLMLTCYVGGRDVLGGNDVDEPEDCFIHDNVGEDSYVSPPHPAITSDADFFSERIRATCST